MVSVRKVVNKRLPLSQAAIKQIAVSVLGKNYEASIVIAGDALLKKLNEAHRQKPGTTNVLSFSLTKTSGEIFLNEKKIALEARAAGKNVRLHFMYIFIHALLHLKGFTHGGTMENEEKKFLSRFSRITK
jgi:probable rRNA maturation factor